MSAAVERIGMLERLLVAYGRSFPCRRGKLRIVNGLWRLAAGRTRQRVATIRHGAMQMPCDLGEDLQRQYYFFGTYFLEEHILDAWTRAALTAKLVFDVGANGGIYGLAALAAQPQSVVHAFEPTPEIAARLRRTTIMNGLERLHVHECAVLDRDGEAVLRRFGADEGGNEGMNYIVPCSGAADDEWVSACRLDTFCADRGIERIDLLKLDVQGNEDAVLEGAGRLVSEGRIGAIFMELNWSDDEHSPAEAAILRLASAGYQFSAPGRRLRWREPGDWLRRLTDVIATQPEPAS